jgi:hypothetical protein
MPRRSLRTLLCLCPAIAVADHLFVVTEGPAAVVRVDSTTGAAATIWRGGHDLDLAVAPDGSRLYITSPDQLNVVDANSGATLAIAPTRTRLMRTLTIGPDMALSPSGRFLYWLSYRPTATTDDMAVATFDTAAGRMLPQEAHLGECQGVRLVPQKTDRQLLAVCGGDSIVHYLQLAEDGSAARNTLIPVPPLPIKPAGFVRFGRKDRQETFEQAALTLDGRTLLLLKEDGRLTMVGINSFDNPFVVFEPPPPAVRVMPAATGFSPDGATWYAPVRPPGPASGDWLEALPVNAQNGHASHAIASGPFRSFAVSRDGYSLYAADPEGRAIRVWNAVTGKQTASFAVEGRPLYTIVLR